MEPEVAALVPLSPENPSSIPTVEDFVVKLNEVPDLTSQDFHLSRIYIYPIKSCGGVRVYKWPLSASGLHLDREWAVISCTTGRVLTQKTHPQLATCKLSFRYRPDICDWDKDDIASAKNIVISAPSMPRILLLHTQYSSPPEHEHATGFPVEGVTVCNRTRPIRRLMDTNSLDIGVNNGTDNHGGFNECMTFDADGWFSEFLGEKVTVVRSGEVTRDGIPTSWDNNTDGVTNFSNEAQFLMITEWSLQNLSSVKYNWLTLCFLS